MAHNPHDKLFKLVFSDPANAVAHFAVCLPPALVAALDLDRARHVPGSWADEALRDHHSDVAHAIPFRRAGPDDEQADRVILYAIWEHQITVDPLMAWRTHRYTMRLLEDWTREHPEVRHLPPVIVLVLYHGEEEWTAPRELEEIFGVDGLAEPVREALRPYLPRQRYLLEVVPEDPREVRTARGIARVTLVALKLGRSAELHALLVELMPDLRVEKAKGEIGLRRIGVFVQYLLVVNKEATPERLAEESKPMGTEVQELPKTWGQRAIEQGREEGRQEEKVDIARKLLAKGMSSAEVDDTTGLPLEEVQKLAH